MYMYMYIINMYIINMYIINMYMYIINMYMYIYMYMYMYMFICICICILEICICILSICICMLSICICICICICIYVYWKYISLPAKGWVKAMNMETLETSFPGSRCESHVAVQPTRYRVLLTMCLTCFNHVLLVKCWMKQRKMGRQSLVSSGYD